MKHPVPTLVRTSLALILTLAWLLGAASPAAATTPVAANASTLTTPLLVDSAGGRLYARVLLDGTPHHIGVYSTRDGKPLASFPYFGPFSLDAAGRRLFVMTAANRVAVLDAKTGELIRSLAVSIDPASRATNGLAPQALSAEPQYDAQARQLLVFVGNKMHTVEPATGKVLGSKAFDVPLQGCGTVNGPLPINRTFFDAENRLLYLEFTTYSCIPWVGYTVVAYDLAQGRELSRQGSLPYSGLAAAGGFYATGWYRMGIGTVWSERNGMPATSRGGWSGGSVFQYDPKRQQLYQSGDGAVRIFDPSGMSLLAVAPQPFNGTLAAYDARTDQVYFVDGATLRPYAAGKLRAAAPAPVRVKALPREPVRAIVPSPNWAKDKTLFALWTRPFLDTACYLFGRTGATFLRSTDGGKTWASGATGLGKDCAQLTALAVSPNYARDRTLFAGIKGNGAFKSTDGGLSWVPASGNLANMTVTGVALPPGDTTQSTVFAAVAESGLQRSKTGGATWETLETPTEPVIALSSEFDRDGTLAVGGAIRGISAVHLSTDRGEQWNALPVQPFAGITLLSLAPQFAKWRVMFVGDDHGDLYRSADAGQTWQRVLQTTPDATVGMGPDRMQIVYGPNEEHREVFLLSAGMRYEREKRIGWGKLYRSPDGGQSWVTMDAGKGKTPTALAISPTYAQDGLLFVGTAEGEILHMKPGVLQ